MDVYIYRADIYCAGCAREIRANLGRTTGLPPLDMREDSEVWPQGPFDDGGGEADAPQHCGKCGGFLENPMTPDGYEYVLEKLELYERFEGEAGVLAEWRDYYGDDHFRDPPTTINEILSKEDEEE